MHAVVEHSFTNVCVVIAFLARCLTVTLLIKISHLYNLYQCVFISSTIVTHGLFHGTAAFTSFSSPESLDVDDKVLLPLLLSLLYSCRSSSDSKPSVTCINTLRLFESQTLSSQKFSGKSLNIEILCISKSRLAGSDVLSFRTVAHSWRYQWCFRGRHVKLFCRRAHGRHQGTGVASSFRHAQL